MVLVVDVVESSSSDKEGLLFIWIQVNRMSLVSLLVECT